MSKVKLLTVFGLATAVCFVLLANGGGPERTYIGADKCKMCHKLQHETWLKTKHAKTWDYLTPADQANEKCIKCHGASKDLPNVQCEACHGPGSEYKSMAVMKDPAKAKAAGCITKDEAVCKACHSADSALFKALTPEEAAKHNVDGPSFKGFNFAEGLKTQVHEHKAK